MRVWPLLCAAVLVVAAVDDVDLPDILLERLAFGSCNKQGREALWDAIADESPQAFLWTGDAAYAENSELSEAQRALEESRADPSYQDFLTRTGVFVDGVWDDNDMGVNDGGKEVPGIQARMRLFLQFLGRLPGSSPHQGPLHLYHTITFGRPPTQVKVIVLDTRSYRDKHAIPSVGAWFRGVPILGKLTPLAAAASRYLATDILGWTQSHQGDILGEEQWAWLDKELESSPAAFHIVVSSIQVFTSTPFLESWGHFPAARDRLVSVLERHAPRGLLLVSGDVHFGEVASHPAPPHCEPPLMGNGSLVPVSWIPEVTSSGMTHSCTTSANTRLWCPIMLDAYESHRLYPAGVYSDRNFGTLRVDWGDSLDEEDPSIPNDAVITAAVHDATGRVVLSFRRASTSLERSNEPHREEGKERTKEGDTPQHGVHHEDQGEL